jgi:hypothetical protein
MASVGTSIVPPGPRPPPADTPGTSAPITTPQVTALHHDFAVSLPRNRGSFTGKTLASQAANKAGWNEWSGLGSSLTISSRWSLSCCAGRTLQPSDPGLRAATAASTSWCLSTASAQWPCTPSTAVGSPAARPAPWWLRNRDLSSSSSLGAALIGRRGRGRT